MKWTQWTLWTAIDRRCQTADDVAAWVAQAAKRSVEREHSDHGSEASTTSTKFTTSTPFTALYPEFSTLRRFVRPA